MYVRMYACKLNYMLPLKSHAVQALSLYAITHCSPLRCLPTQHIHVRPVQNATSLSLSQPDAYAQRRARAYINKAVLKRSNVPCNALPANSTEPLQAYTSTLVHIGAHLPVQS